jgi:hypothetical protein
VLTRLLADALGGNALCLSVGTLKQGDWDGSVTTLQHLQVCEDLGWYPL